VKRKKGCSSVDGQGRVAARGARSVCWQASWCCRHFPACFLPHVSSSPVVATSPTHSFLQTVFCCMQLEADFSFITRMPQTAADVSGSDRLWGYGRFFRALGAFRFVLCAFCHGELRSSSHDRHSLPEPQECGLLHLCACRRQVIWRLMETLPQAVLAHGPCHSSPLGPVQLPDGWLLYLFPPVFSAQALRAPTL